MKGLITRFKTAGELLHFLWKNKFWWLVPLVAVLLILGVAVVAVQTSAIAPFIYTLF